MITAKIEWEKVKFNDGLVTLPNDNSKDIIIDLYAWTRFAGFHYEVKTRELNLRFNKTDSDEFTLNNILISSARLVFSNLASLEITSGDLTLSTRVFEDLGNIIFYKSPNGKKEVLITFNDEMSIKASFEDLRIEAEELVQKKKFGQKMKNLFK